MEFNFSEDQLLLQETVREFLALEHTPELIRGVWSEDASHSPEFWKRFADIGVPGLLVGEDAGGLGMNEIDLALLLEETGRAAMPETMISTAVGVRLIAESGSATLADAWLPKVAAGDALLAVGCSESPFVVDADIADLLLLADGDDVHGVERSRTALTRQHANDPSRRLFSVEWSPSDETRFASGAAGRALQSAALDRGAFACAATQLGVAQQLIDMAAEYACQRKQFGVAIGSFQAVKHMLANLQVQVEYARSVVYRAAHSVACNVRCRSVDTAMAKLAASDAAVASAKTALQVHGAIGYTWEQDLHLWMRRAWSLERAWGSSAFHLKRVGDAVLDHTTPAESFGYSPPAA